MEASSFAQPGRYLAMTEGPFETFKDELKAIRLSLYEETKGMTPEEEAAYFDALTEPLMKQYHFKVSTLKPVMPKKRIKASSE